LTFAVGGSWANGLSDALETPRRIIIPDLRNHGESAHSRSMGYHPPLSSESGADKTVKAGFWPLIRQSRPDSDLWNQISGTTASRRTHGAWGDTLRFRANSGSLSVSLSLCLYAFLPLCLSLYFWGGCS
jgi:hypothetical protein